MIKRLLSLVVAASLMTFAAAQAPTPVKVGALMSYTGTLAEFGPAIERGIELALIQINEAAEEFFGGPILELVTEDDATNPNTGVERARKMVNTDNVVAIIGGLASGVTAAVAESVSIPNGVVTISPASTSPVISFLPDLEGYVFRTVASDSLQGVVSAMLARGEIVEGHSYDTASVIYLNEAYGQGLAQAFKAAFEARGGKVLEMVPIDTVQQPTYTAQLERALQDNPDVLYAVSYPGEAEVFLQESRDIFGYTSWQFVDGTQSIDIINATGADVIEGSYGTSAGADPAWAGYARFVEFYEAQYDEKPPLPYMDTGYDAMATIGLAVAQALIEGVDVDSDAVRDRLRVVANPDGETVGVGDFAKAFELLAAGTAIDYTGAAGEVDYDESGDVITPIEVWQYTDGTIKTFRVLTVNEIPAE